ncbi:ATP-binding protein [Sphaerisporangium sp. B11E5]|uniref:ATP-binding protein n=1 Tax=Sphaerisporangium sp. B11E5 TaxID=3153563 RepID=UPI00325E58EB
MEPLDAGARVLQVLEREVSGVGLLHRDEMAGHGETGWVPGARAVGGYVTLPGRVEQVAMARGFVRRVLGGDPLLDSVLLVVSELVSNSVVHSRSSLPGGSVTVYVLHAGARVRVEVLDDGARGFPCMRPTDGAALPGWVGALDTIEVGGRGLRLVDAVAACWGVTLRHRRTVTWAEVAGGTGGVQSWGPVVSD